MLHAPPNDEEEHLRVVFVLVGCTVAIMSGVLILWGVAATGRANGGADEYPTLQMIKAARRARACGALRVCGRPSCVPLPEFADSPLRRLWAAYECDSSYEDVHYKHV